MKTQIKITNIQKLILLVFLGTIICVSVMNPLHSQCDTPYEESDCWNAYDIRQANCDYEHFITIATETVQSFITGLALGITIAASGGTAAIVIAGLGATGSSIDILQDLYTANNTYNTCSDNAADQMGSCMFGDCWGRTNWS